MLSRQLYAALWAVWHAPTPYPERVHRAVVDVLARRVSAHDFVAALPEMLGAVCVRAAGPADGASDEFPHLLHAHIEVAHGMLAQDPTIILMQSLGGDPWPRGLCEAAEAWLAGVGRPPARVTMTETDVMLDEALGIRVAILPVH